MTKDQSTPRPWRVKEGLNNCSIFSNTGVPVRFGKDELVCTTPNYREDNGLANARLIVKAVNALNGDLFTLVKIWVEENNGIYPSDMKRHSAITYHIHQLEQLFGEVTDEHKKINP